MIQGISSSVLDSVNNATSTSTAPPKTSQTIDQGEFLKLFVAQLQHQDPLSPMEPNELTSQLAQFSSLEQLTTINSHLDAMTDSTKQTTTTAMLGLIGKQVRFDGSQLTLAGGRSSGVQYTLDGPADRVAITIRDSVGNVVRAVDLGSQAAGTHTFEFDGKDQNGQKLADGTYRVEAAWQAPGARVATPLDLVVDATVDGVDMSGDSPVLLVGDARVPLEKIREVHVSNR